MENNQIREPGGSELAVYALRFLPYGERALFTALDHVRETCGMEGDEADEYARRWRGGLLAAVGTLATLPMRFPVAPEAASFAPPPVRVIPYRHRPGGAFCTAFTRPTRTMRGAWKLSPFAMPRKNRSRAAKGATLTPPTDKPVANR